MIFFAVLGYNVLLLYPETFGVLCYPRVAPWVIHIKPFGLAVAAYFRIKSV